MNTKIKSIIMMLLIASVFFAVPASANVIDEIRGYFKSLMIFSWVEGQPFVVEANGIKYDTYLTNVVFPDCIQNSPQSVLTIELYPKGANYGMTQALAHRCTYGNPPDAKALLTKVGQELANNYKVPGVTPKPYTPQPVWTSKPSQPSQPFKPVGCSDDTVLINGKCVKIVPGMPGFEIPVSIAGLLSIFYILKRRTI